MWDDVIIGAGNKGTTAFRVFEIAGNENIARNSVSYWIDNVYLGLGMTVFTDTPEGRWLTKVIEDKLPLHEINAELTRWVLKLTPPDKLQASIDAAIHEAFNKGRKTRSAELRDLLLE